MTPLSPARADEILDALRRGTVPESALDAFAVGLEPYRDTLRTELEQCAAGRGRFKAVRGEYGTGKTFFARWFQGLARSERFATSEVQISETETPLHKLETVYRRLTEHLTTAESQRGALRSIIDGWFYSLEEEVVARLPTSQEQALLGIVRNTPILEVHRSNYTKDKKTVVMFSRIIFVAKFFVLEYDYATPLWSDK